MRAALALLALFAASAEAQTPPAPGVTRPVPVTPAPVKPVPAKPVVTKPATKPAASVETLKTDLAAVNAKISSFEQAQKERDRQAKSKDAISGMSMDDMLALQQMMDRKAELEKMISDTMKAASE